MIKIKMDVTKIPKDKIFVGAKGKYIDLVLFENRETDQYGNDGFVSIDTTKEERESGEKGVIVGNWKHLGGKKPASQSMPQRPAQPSRKPAAPPPRPPSDPDLDAPEPEIPF